MRRTSVPRTRIFSASLHHLMKHSMKSRTQPRLAAGRSGFTLIEILVVIVLIGLIMAIGLPTLGVSLKVNIQSSGRDLANVIRTTYDEAVLKGNVYRIAMDIDKGEYWVESGPKNYTMLTQDQEEEERRRISRLSKEEQANYQPPFSIVQSINRGKKKSLAKGVHFTDILTSRSKELQKGGVVYAHVFPHGFIEKLVIYIKDDFDRESTLIVNSVTGKSRLLQHRSTEID